MDKRTLRRYIIALLAASSAIILTGWHRIAKYIQTDNPIFKLFLIGFLIYIVYIFAKDKMI